MKAEDVSQLFGDNGQCFTLSDGSWIEDVCAEFGAHREFADVLQDHVTGAVEIVPISASEATSQSRVRWVFPDGSAIVIAGDAWDIEGDSPFVWHGERI